MFRTQEVPARSSLVEEMQRELEGWKRPKVRAWLDLLCCLPRTRAGLQCDNASLLEWADSPCE